MSFNSNSFSSFWDTSSDSNVDEFLGLDTETPKGKDIVALAGYKRAIGNFVNIVTAIPEVSVANFKAPVALVI